MNDSIPVVLQIKANFSRLTPSELQVATYITENPDQVIHCSVAELAELSRVSEATVVRFCKKIGFQSEPLTAVSTTAALSTRSLTAFLKAHSRRCS